MRSIQNFEARVADYKLKLSDISLKEGEVTLLYGPSGSGKTSFLLGLLGVLPCTYNLYLNVEGQDLDVGALPSVDKNFGAVFQFENLFDHISVYKNLLLIKPNHEDEEHFVSRAESFGLLNLMDKKAHVLSGGEQQMVACVRLFLQHNRRLLVLDEPWSAMDPENKNRFRQMLKQHVKKVNVPCIVVSHDMDEASHLSPQYQFDFNQVARFEKGQP